MKITLGAILTISVLFGLVVVFWLGAFSASFTTNLCYSEVIGKISEQVKKQESLESLAELSGKLESLPLAGYESNCEEIKSKVQNL